MYLIFVTPGFQQKVFHTEFFQTTVLTGIIVQYIKFYDSAFARVSYVSGLQRAFCQTDEITA